LKGKLRVKLTKVNTRVSESWLNLDEKGAVYQEKDGPIGERPWFPAYTTLTATLTILNHEDQIKKVSFGRAYEKRSQIRPKTAEFMNGELRDHCAVKLT